MGALEILGQQVHRGAHLGMSEDDRQPHHIPAVSKVMGCEGMTEQMKPRLREPQVLQQAVVAPASISMLPLSTIACGEHQVRANVGSLLDLPKPEQQLPQLDGERHLPLFPSLAHYSEQQIVEVEVAHASSQQFIDPAAGVEDGAGNGVDTPAIKRARPVAEKQPQSSGVVQR